MDLKPEVRTYVYREEDLEEEHPENSQKKPLEAFRDKHQDSASTIDASIDASEHCAAA